MSENIQWYNGTEGRKYTKKEIEQEYVCLDCVDFLHHHIWTYKKHDFYNHCGACFNCGVDITHWRIE